MNIDSSVHNAVVISDTHFGHKNIIRYTGRPVDCDQRMFDAFQRYWGADYIIHVGDFSTWYKVTDEEALGWYNKMFAGTNPILIRGNHDRDDSPTMKLPWTEIIENEDQPYAIKYDDLRIGFKHWPYTIRTKFHDGEPIIDHNLLTELDVAIHGHIHEKGQRYQWIGGWSGTLMVNACVEHWDFRPFDLDEIAAEYYARRQYNKEGHGQRRR